MSIIKKIAVVILCLVFLWVIPQSVQAEYSGDYEYTLKSDGTASVCAYTGEAVAVTIPRELDGYPVTEISNKSLSPYLNHFYKATEITIPDSVTCIGNNAFYGFINLTKINIPNSITVIGERAFASCSGLTAVAIPDGVTSIGKDAFRNCDGLTSITIPESVVSIGEGAFSYCPNVQEFYVSPRNPMYASIDGVLFEKATRTLVQYPLGREDDSYTVPNGVEVIGENAFNYNWASREKASPLCSVTLPDSLCRIGSYAFSGCSGLSYIVIPEGVSEIDSRAFSDCSGLIDFVIPEGITKIGWGAFCNCSSLISIVIPEGVTELFLTFAGCTSLTDVTLPESLQSIEYGSFSGCENLRKITIPKNVSVIGWNAFAGSGLTSITLPGSLTRWDTAFWNCEDLEEVTLSEGITEIPSWAFAGCGSLQTVNLPLGLRFVGKNAFDGCTGLTAIDLSRCPFLLVIDEAAFRNCTTLAEVTLPDTLYSLCNAAFEGCSALRVVNWVGVSAADIPLVDGEINYVTSADRAEMIRFLARYHAWQAGKIVLPDTDAEGVQNDPEAWRTAKITKIEQQITDMETDIASIKVQLADPDISEGKARALNKRIDSLQDTILTDQETIAQWRSAILMTDSMAAAVLEEAEGIRNDPSCDMILYQAWKQIYLPLSFNRGIPEGFRTYKDFFTSEEGLRYVTADINTLDRITTAFREGDDGSLIFIPGMGTPGIGTSAFSGCYALESATIPDSISAISNDAFRDCKNLTITLTPDSPAEQFCISQGIHYEYENGNNWLSE